MTRRFNVVYDCGSWSTSILDREIKKTFHTTDCIDALFISHFDRDHINGISKLGKLKVRNLILPLLKDTHKILAFLSTGIPSFNPREIAKFLGVEPDNIILVEPYLGDDRPQQPAELDLNDMPRWDRPIVVQSGTPIKIKGMVPWIYVPFNIVDNTEYDAFLQELTKKHTPLALKLQKFTESEELQRISDILDEKEINELAAIYNKISGEDKNSTSLVVYSGPPAAADPEEEPRRRRCCINRSPDFDFWFEHHRLWPIGALYTGDINLTQTKNFAGATVDVLIRNAVNKYIVNIGLVQIPHHGSKHNFSCDFIGLFPRAHSFFYSFGVKNRFGHPYSAIRQYIIAYRRKLYEVTEDAQSEVMQLFEI